MTAQSHLGPLKGAGSIMVGVHVADADYRIHATKPRHLIGAEGSLTTDAPIVQAMVDGGGAVLRLQGGGALDVVPMRSDVSAGKAHFKVAGVLPGY